MLADANLPYPYGSIVREAVTVSLSKKQSQVTDLQLKDNFYWKIICCRV